MAGERGTTEQRQAQIAEAALRILAADGVRRLTAAALGEAVGLRDASLFRHFPHMQAIVEAAVDRFETWLAASLERPEADPLERLRAFFVHRQALLRARPEILRLAFNDRLEEAAGAERVRQVLGRSRAFLRTCLAEAQAGGGVRADVPAEVLQWTVMGVMRGAALETGPDAASPEAVWLSLARLLAAPDSRSNPTPQGGRP